MKRQLTKAAQVAKLIRTDLKKLGIKAKATSSNYSMGDSVTVKIENASPSLLQELKARYAKYQYGHFDGMTDSYEYSNSRKDIPQTKFLFIEGARA